MKKIFAAMLLLTLIGAGCAKVQTESGEEWGSVPRNQSKPLSTVKAQAKSLSSGMSKADVQRLLGEPAHMDDKTWIYLPNRGGGITLDKKLLVKFFGDTYVSHTFRTTFATDYLYPSR